MHWKLLYTGDFIQQNEAKSWAADDPQNMCLYVDDHNGTSTFILIKQENLCACSEASCMGIFSVKKQHCGKHKKVLQ